MYFFSILLPYLLLCIILVYDKLDTLWASALYGSDERSINTIQYNTIQRNIGARSCSIFCSVKAIHITHPECVFVALVIQHTMRIHYFRSKHCVTADWLALLLLIRKAPLSTLARLRDRVDFPQSIHRWVGHVARTGRGDVHTRC